MRKTSKIYPESSHKIDRFNQSFFSEIGLKIPGKFTQNRLSFP